MNPMNDNLVNNPNFGQQFVQQPGQPGQQLPPPQQLAQQLAHQQLAQQQAQQQAHQAQPIQAVIAGGGDLLSDENLLRFAQYLVQKLHNVNHSLPIRLASGTLYNVWVKSLQGSLIVSMQPNANFRSMGPANKLSMKIGAHGIESIFHSDNNLNQTHIPDMLRGQVLEIFGKIQQRMLEEQQQAAAAALPPAPPQPLPPQLGVVPPPQEAPPMPLPADVAPPQGAAPALPPPLPAAAQLAAEVEVQPGQEAPPVAGPAQEAGQELFSAAELINFRTVLLKYNYTANKPLTVELTSPFMEHSAMLGNIPVTKYQVWYSPQHHSFNIQPFQLWNYGSLECKLSVGINEVGKVKSVYYANVPQSKEEGEQIFAANKEKMKDVFHASLKKSSVYKKPADEWGNVILVVNRGLKEIPEFHIGEYVKLNEGMYQGTDPQWLLKVKYLEDDLSEQAGIDASGLSRAYFDMIFRGLTDPKHAGAVRFASLSEEVTKLVRPQTKTDYDENNPEQFPQLLPEENRSYENIGKMMMIAYLRNEVNIGRHFDKSFFQTILSLTPEAMDTPFPNLPFNQRVSILKMLLPDDLMAYVKQKMLPLIEGIDLGDDIIQECQYFFQARPELIEPFKTDDEFDLAKARGPGGQGISQDFREALMNEVLAQNLQVMQSIAPIQAIARGMKSFCVQRKVGENAQQFLASQNKHWKEKIQTTSVYDFSLKIQGSLDKNTIAQKIVVENTPPQYRPELEKKANWLRNWIKNPATTEEELEGFLRFTTSSGSLGSKNIPIIMEHNFNSAIPKAHTCFNQLVVSYVPAGNAMINDRTEQGFIKALKYGIANSDENFHVM